MRVRGILAVVKPLVQEKSISASILISFIFRVYSFSGPCPRPSTPLVLKFAAPNRTNVKTFVIAPFHFCISRCVQCSAVRCSRAERSRILGDAGLSAKIHPNERSLRSGNFSHELRSQPPSNLATLTDYSISVVELLPCFARYL